MDGVDELFMLNQIINLDKHLERLIQKVYYYTKE